MIKKEVRNKELVNKEGEENVEGFTDESNIYK